MELTFIAMAEDEPGPKWQGLFAARWDAYRAWYLRQGVEDRPTYAACLRALKKHMPELVPVYDRLCDLAGGGDIAARFLSLYRPPAYLTGCSQAVWPGDEPLLVRNYDYAPEAFDAVILKTRWLGRRVIAMSDCMIGLVDGMNESGLSVSLTFGGRRETGDGFGVPIILRYVLETCDTAEQAGRALARIPTHMAYNVTALDAKGNRVTVYMTPDKKARVTKAAVATNHQERVEWSRHARVTASVERERFLLQRLMLHEEPQDRFVHAFLRPPLYSLAFDRGFGTLYTAAYRPARGEAVYQWPGADWTQSFDAFAEGRRRVAYPISS